MTVTDTWGSGKTTKRMNRAQLSTIRVNGTKNTVRAHSPTESVLYMRGNGKTIIITGRAHIPVVTAVDVTDKVVKDFTGDDLEKIGEYLDQVCVWDIINI